MVAATVPGGRLARPSITPGIPSGEPVAARLSPRRRLLFALAVGALGPARLGAATAAPEASRRSNAGRQASEPAWPEVVPGRRFVFPRDHGMHPAYRIEWWYITGWLEGEQGPLGWQITFFRVRTRYSAADPGRFAPRQLVLAHAALADPGLGRLRHAQQAWRSGSLASIASEDTRIALPGWSLERDADDRYHTRVETPEFAWRLQLAAGEAPVLQGDAGYSRKGPRPQEASYYYSRPGLRGTGELRIGAHAQAVRGTGWLDHEWSSELMPAAARGWDWAGIELDDGASLIIFRLRDADGGAVHSYGRLRRRDGHTTDADPRFEALRFWQSARTGIRYPVQWRIGFGARQFILVPLFDDQELDARQSTGTIYWEGAVRLLEDDRPIGRGYLEMTGYGEQLLL